MTEREKMEYAKSYIDKLAQGVDPTSDVEIPRDSVLDNPRIMRCLFYVSQLLDRLISASDENGKLRSASKSKKPLFTATQEQLAAVPLSNSPVSISVFVKNIQALIDPEGEMSLAATWITEWLADKGFLRVVNLGNDQKERRNKEVTEHGQALGITTADATAPNGQAIRMNWYNKDAQQFILDHLLEIVSGH